MVALEHHHFWTDDVAAAEEDHGPFARVVGYRQVPDAHLLTLALHRGGVLATFNRGVGELVPPGVEAATALEVIA